MAHPKDAHTELNEVQDNLLRLLIEEVNKVATEKGYSQEDFDKMLNSNS